MEKEYMTVVFNKSVTDFDKNPLHIKTEFGDVVAISLGNQLCEVREMTVEGVARMIAKDIAGGDKDMELYWSDVVEEPVRKLAKLGTIRIKEQTE